VNKYNI